MDSKNIKYIVLSIVLLILSVFGVIFIFKINPSPLSVFSSTPKTEVPTGRGFKTEPQEVEMPEINITETEASITGKLSPTSKPTIIPTKKPTPTSIPTKVPTLKPASSIPTISTFTNSENNFSINYLSNRKLYSDKEKFGDRYTFYNTLGNFAVHVTPSGTWSWINSGRNFNSNFIVAGQNTYRYDISSQTIVDIQTGSKNYTIQCVHNGRKDLKLECEEFIKSFTLTEPDPVQDLSADLESDFATE